PPSPQIHHSMKTINETSITVLRFLLNKSAAIALLLGLMHWYHALPSGEDAATPYAELIYLAILITGSTVVAPLLRLLVFPEAAAYAETGKLRRDLAFQAGTPALRHYWFATAISYLVTIACA